MEENTTPAPQIIDPDAVAQLVESIRPAIESLGKALREAFAPFVAGLWEDLNSLFADMQKWLSLERAAFEWAETVHPEWVRIYKRTKKKRTRKKYHDRIMRAYVEELT